MKNDRQYQGVQLSKKESELIIFLQTGSNDWIGAFYIYKHRKGGNKYNPDTRKQSSWFNSTLKKLQKKNLCLNIPFVWGGIQWMNPGTEASKANLVIEEASNVQREIVTPKPII